MRHTHMLHVVALTTTLMAFSPSASPSEVPHLRTGSRFLHEMIAEGREHSPTFQALAAALEASDVIVYFEAVPHMEGRYRGRVHFMSATAGFRYVRIQVRTAMNKYDIVASMAHEMQHANEIAEDPDVRCEESLAAMYRRIGDEHNWCMFETEKAQQAGRAVRAEVFGM